MGNGKMALLASRPKPGPKTQVELVYAIAPTKPSPNLKFFSKVKREAQQEACGSSSPCSLGGETLKFLRNPAQGPLQLR